MCVCVYIYKYIYHTLIIFFINIILLYIGCYYYLFF